MFPEIQDLIICTICKKFLQKPFECTKCSTLYCSNCFVKCLNCDNKDIKVSLAIQGLLDKRNRTCVDCGKEYKNINELNSHINSVHKELFKCLKCQDTFNLENQFKDHINKAHSKIIIEIFNQNSLFNMNENVLKSLINNKYSELNSENEKETILNTDNNPYNNNDSVIDNDNNDNNDNNDYNHNKAQFRLTIQPNTTVLSATILGNESIINKDIYSERSRIRDVSSEATLIKRINLNQLNLWNSKIDMGNPIQVDDLIHCGKKVLECSCCQDRKCRNGNCFCPNCMKKNKLNKIQKNQLFNKDNRIAVKYGDRYYCGINFISEVSSYYEKINTPNKCWYPKNCSACEALNNNLFMYKDI